MSNYLLAREYLPNAILPIDLNDKRQIYEISVPTCSYRMGVDRIGYGVLLLDSGKKIRECVYPHTFIDFFSDTKTAHLTILSTPRRYISLYLYAAYGIFFVLFLILTSLFPRRSFYKWLRSNR